MFSLNGRWVSSIQADMYSGACKFGFAPEAYPREHDRAFYGYYPDDPEAGEGRVYPCKIIYKKDEKSLDS